MLLQIAFGVEINASWWNTIVDNTDITVEWSPSLRQPVKLKRTKTWHRKLKTTE
jgi:hypothetical protein